MKLKPISITSTILMTSGSEPFHASGGSIQFQPLNSRQWGLLRDEDISQSSLRFDQQEMDAPKTNVSFYDIVEPVAPLELLGDLITSIVPQYRKSEISLDIDSQILRYCFFINKNQA